jgi:hypothetical protein
MCMPRHAVVQPFPLNPKFGTLLHIAELPFFRMSNVPGAAVCNGTGEEAAGVRLRTETRTTEEEAYEEED